jgi:NADPH2:quinone reductase
MRRGAYPGQPPFPFVPGYDFVGIVLAVGDGVRQDLTGQRVAAVTKTGGWATHILVPAQDLVPVPAALDAALVETVLVNGITAWQMLHREAQVKPGQTILVHGANGGVGIVLSQLALHAGIRVIGTAAPRHHEALRSLGVEPVDYNAPDLAASVKALTPEGVDAAFDHLGLKSARISYSLLASGGSLICYGNAALVNSTSLCGRSMIGVFLKLHTQMSLWNILPNSPPFTTSGATISCVPPPFAAAFVKTWRSCSHCCRKELFIHPSLRGSHCRRQAPRCNWRNRALCAGR